MPKITKCSFSGCESNVMNNKDLSFFKYPVTDRKRCEKWVKASNNPQIIELFKQNSRILSYRTVCESHFHSKDISVYDHRKKLNTKSLPNNEFIFNHNYNNSYNNININNNRITNSSIVKNSNKLINKSVKRESNSLEIIEINNESIDYLVNKKRKFNNNCNNIEIIEIEDNRTTNNKFLLGHELFKLKKESNNKLNSFEKNINLNEFTIESNYMCNDCDLMFETEELFRTHIESHSDNNSQQSSHDSYESNCFDYKTSKPVINL